MNFMKVHTVSIFYYEIPLPSNVNRAPLLLDIEMETNKRMEFSFNRIPKY